ncbi:MAG: hypothetical protein HDQ99_19885 [Lachnospiraceae bacterium]|nr:hypothetical protein [Lachnospiraceae bacterium]
MKKNKTSKIDYKWLVSTTIAIIALFFAITRESSVRDWVGNTSIDFTKIIPYEWSGADIDNRNNFIYSLSMDNITIDEYYKACDVRAYFKNSNASIYRISDMFINIEEITPILQSDINIAAVVVNNCIYVYVINQGLEKEENIKIDVKAKYYNNSEQTYINMNKYFEFNNCASSLDIDCIYGGEIIEIFSFNINNDGISLISQNNYLILGADLYFQDTSQYIYLGLLSYNEFDKSIKISKSEGDNNISATFVAFVDVNNGSGKYSIPMQTNPNIENDFNVGIDTIVIPNQSCDIKFYISYKIGKDIIRTESISTRIIVPLYKDDSGFYDSLLIYCVENQIKNYKKDTQPYIENALKYDVYSILDEINYIK